MNNIHGGVIRLVKLQTLACNLLKVLLLHGCFSHFLICANVTKFPQCFTNADFFRDIHTLPPFVCKLLVNVRSLFLLFLLPGCIFIFVCLTSGFIIIWHSVNLSLAYLENHREILSKSLSLLFRIHIFLLTPFDT